MYRKQYILKCAALSAAVMLLGYARAYAQQDQAASEQESGLIEALQSSDTPPAEKAMTCKKLTIHGTSRAVPALAPLLGDERLASWARIALEAIPGPEADEALRSALSEQKGLLLVGVINSIGVRRDARAVEPLAQRLTDQDPDVASAAAVALGKIGGDAATTALSRSLESAPNPVRNAVAEGCILCAERLLADQRSDDAAKLYDQVRQADVPQPRILEATRGAVLARKTDGIPLLVELLRSDDRGLLHMGLSAARELQGREVTDAIAAELVRADARRGALLLNALADRGETVGSPVVLRSAKEGATPVRIAAIGLLGRLGDADAVPVLLDISVEEDPETSSAAREALAGLSGEKVDQAIVDRLSGADEKIQAVLLELIGRRRIPAIEQLREAIDHRSAAIRHAALSALGETAGPDHLDVLIARATSSRNPEDSPVAQAALRQACVRMPDREACAARLTEAIDAAPVEIKCVCLEILGEMQGATALETIGRVSKSDIPQLQDDGTRLLGRWMSVDAAPVLLDLAKTAPEEKYRIRSLRGYIRLARQFNMPDDRRAEMCAGALAASRRDEERKLTLQVLERYPSVETLKVAVQAGKTAGIKQDADRVALAIAGKLGGDRVDARRLLTEIGQDPVKVEIVQAQYGAGDDVKDVTAILRKVVTDLPLLSLPSGYNESFGGDPAPGVVKQLKIQYRIDGKPGEATFAENSLIILPTPR